MKKLYSLFFLVIIQSIAYSQSPQIQWTKYFVYSNLENNIKGIAIDKQDNIYITGNYITNDYLQNTFVWGSFVNKIDPSGNIIWGDTTSELGVSTNVIALSENHFYTLGQSFIKRNFNGDTVWKKNIAGQGISYLNNALYLGNYNTLYKYDLNGSIIWDRPISTYGPLQVKTSENYLYVKAGDGNSYNPSIIHKYDTLGNLIWSKPSGMGYVWNMTTDTTGNCYVIGSGKVKKINSNGITAWTIYSDSLAWYNATVNNDTLYICGSSGESPSDTRKSSVSLYSAQTGQFLSSHLIDVLPGIVEQANFILKDSNDIYLAGAGGYQMATLYLSKISLNNIATSVKGIKKNEGSFNIYPNPTAGIFQITYSFGWAQDKSSTEKGELHLNVINAKGEKVYEESISQNKCEYKDGSTTFSTSIDLSNQPKGVYFIEIINNKKKALKKVVLE